MEIFKFHMKNTEVFIIKQRKCLCLMKNNWINFDFLKYRLKEKRLVFNVPEKVHTSTKGISTWIILQLNLIALHKNKFGWQIYALMVHNLSLVYRKLLKKCLKWTKCLKSIIEEMLSHILRKSGPYLIPFETWQQHFEFSSVLIDITCFNWR